jgi:hypothetical protein
MKNIKIIKRKASGGEPDVPPVAAQKKQSNPARFQREMTTVINGWISDWRGRKQIDARAAFTDLFETSAI